MKKNPKANKNVQQKINDYQIFDIVVVVKKLIRIFAVFINNFFSLKFVFFSR